VVGATKAARLALRAAALFIVWLLIDDNVAQPELFTGVVVAMLALALAIVVRRSSTVHGRSGCRCCAERGGCRSC